MPDHRYQRKRRRTQLPGSSSAIGGQQPFAVGQAGPGFALLGEGDRGVSHAVDWEPMDTMQRRALMQWLYGRDQCWLDRSAPQEWKALLALLKRLLRKPNLGPCIAASPHCLSGQHVWPALTDQQQ